MFDQVLVDFMHSRGTLYVDIDMRSHVFTSLVGLLVAMAISAPSSAQIRVVSYNSAQFHL